ncbi:MAG: alpha/beta hydrolase, partial [Pseudomonadota bacterium]
VRAPDRIGRTVLVSTAPSFPAPARALMRPAGPEAQDAAAWAEMRRKHPGGDDQVRALFRAACELDRSDVDLSPSELGRIRRECLVVHGDADPFYPMALVAEMRRAIPRGWLWALPWEGHCPIFGEKAARFREASLAFLTAPATLRRGA